MQSECELAATSQAPSAARSFALQVLHRTLDGSVPQTLADDVQLVVSELVTNAVRAGSRQIFLSLDVERRSVTVQVHDDADGWPRRRAARGGEAGGRGLPLVDAVSTAWGVRALEAGQGGKVVWAELTVPAT